MLNTHLQKTRKDILKKYTKAKNAVRILTKQIDDTKEEIEYLEGQLINLEQCTLPTEIDEIREELSDMGYIRKKDKNKKQKKVVSQPIHVVSSDNFDIYIGKNNVQNDYLTLRFASANDIWLHTKNIPGSHVIIKNKDSNIPYTTILEAAKLAAAHSKAKNSSNVPVDYTFKKYVKKPSGAKPGFVIYTNQKTLYVTP
ncbi:NFACT RNA binding domain-containing protein [Thermoanaerobacterium sp. RBIITD]|uniref:NFACT RNA binding domain-containing protein n=1 Tax=Thermoanaerobacterium sp. RBIITD TaxID=1550240 RepID=UPI002101D388|nr:NFACT RNA binding domain-containing protein [Thermoanaerobacterium sp. RBIITD]